MSKEKKVQAFCLGGFVLGLGAQAQAGEIYDMDRDVFEYLEKLGCVREATSGDVKAAKAAK